MKKILTSMALTLALSVPAIASAATVTNLDDVTHTLLVSEGGHQIELSIGPGETIEICPEGCFVTLPNGDREVLTGPETLEIRGNRARVF